MTTRATSQTSAVRGAAAAQGVDAPAAAVTDASRTSLRFLGDLLLLIGP